MNLFFVTVKDLNTAKPAAILDAIAQMLYIK